MHGWLDGCTHGWPDVGVSPAIRVIASPDVQRGGLTYRRD